uniref:Calcineurin-like phosphoesterase domain-containing protein n=1 Tax=Oryza punctata TaxID=4537 RepID=A0A0E0M3U0_ORYPU
MGLAHRRRLLLHLLLVAAAAEAAAGAGRKEKGIGGGGGGGGLRFRSGSGTFKVVQVADMHYADGRRTGCLDVLPSEVAGCSDLNTTAFLYRLFRAEDPDLVVFTGDNIYGFDATDAAKSMDAAIAPAINMNLPWAAVIGNHDQEVVTILRCLPSVDMTKYMKEEPKQKAAAPGLVYFHIPLPEFSSFTSSNFTGVKQEGISSPSINSGFFASMVEAGDVKAAFIGHDHVNDFCGKLNGIQLCYAGGFGYHAYGKAGWSRRARVVSVQLEKTDGGEWRGVKSIKTWKRLDDPHLTTIDSEVLWNRGSNGRRKKNPDGKIR